MRTFSRSSGRIWSVAKSYIYIHIYVYIYTYAHLLGLYKILFYF